MFDSNATTEVAARSRLANDGILFSRALLIDHANMSPTIPRGSVVFLGESGEFSEGNGIVALPDHETGAPTPDLRMFQGAPSGRVLLWADDKTAVPPVEITLAEWRRLRAWPIVGYMVPRSPGFRAFIDDRFGRGAHVEPQAAAAP